MLAGEFDRFFHWNVMKIVWLGVWCMDGRNKSKKERQQLIIFTFVEFRFRMLDNLAVLQWMKTVVAMLPIYLISFKTLRVDAALATVVNIS